MENETLNYLWPILTGSLIVPLVTWIKAKLPEDFPIGVPLISSVLQLAVMWLLAQGLAPDMTFQQIIAFALGGQVMGQMTHAGHKTYKKLAEARTNGKPGPGAAGTAVIAFLVGILACGSVQAQEPVSPPVQFVASASAWSDDSFRQELDAGFNLGFQVPLDGSRGVYLRTMYTRWNFRPDVPIQAMKVTMLLEYWLGRGWWFYGVAGGDFFIGGDNEGGDFSGGLGAARTVYTFMADDRLQPGRLDVFLDLDFTDASGQVTGAYLQLNLGVKFAPPSGAVN